MKTLYLVRHAKSSWKFDVIDHQRPLNERGLHDAPIVAAHVAASMPKPDLIMSSDAMRAKTTSFFFAKAYDISEKDIVLDHTLYDFDGRDLVEVIRSCDDAVDCLMVFGHNNAMTNVVNTYGDKHIDNVPTCGFTAITFDIDHWKDMSQGKTIFTSTPKEL
ncbi:histidine phosphatase family protein [uncultured Dokdonia sp.]|uniref:SixA phosphatase family protein n=1 Tax=uncultured Dokdonia sp. TaxID=575653 RepID=UPI0026030E44|nr:histidine phosphatase family protein [uncultured Dokdonia sp.]